MKNPYPSSTMEKMFKFTRKDFFYISLILIMAVTFLAYNLRVRIAQSDLGQELIKVKNNFLLTIESRTASEESLTRKELKELITSEVPVLSQENASDFEKVSSLREWVFNNVPVVDENLLIENVLDTPYYSRIPLTERITTFRKGLAGAWCGATAGTLMDVYNLFGYEAYIVDHGNSSFSWTHVITIVKILDDGRSIYSVQDAYLNNTWVGKYGRPRDYFGGLALIRTKNIDDVLYKWGESDGRYNKPHLLTQSTDSDKIVKSFANGNVIEKRRFLGYDDLLEQAKPLLTTHNYPNDLIYFSLFPFAAYGDDDKKAKTILNMAKRVSGTYCESKQKCDPRNTI